MVRCSVKGCKSDSGTKMPGLSFHSFPEPDNLRRNWIVATGRKDWTPKPSSKICSIHFDNKMLIKKRKLTLLFPNAVPILETEAGIRSSSSFGLHEETIIKVENNLNTHETEAGIRSSSSFGLHEETIIKVENNLNTHETEAGIRSSPSFGLHEETIIKIENNIDTHIDSAIDHLPSTSGQKSVEIVNPPIPQQPSIDKTPEYSPRTLRKKLINSEKLSSERLKKLKALREKNRRLTKKVAKLENIINLYTKKIDV